MIISRNKSTILKGLAILSVFISHYGILSQVAATGVAVFFILIWLWFRKINIKKWIRFILEKKDQIRIYTILDSDNYIYNTTRIDFKF
ncbi:hypothetical protein UB38_10895 [Photobacterium iliopiscarium]|nr:hypothetical protein UB38_10895 [Photobacterium iliopiscarium]